ncbi:MAG TPA: RhuM family protein, partial [Planctomycetaceae bacterium]|nr:RhuM family protein [Planctomycetaceae bacterium]
EVTRKLRHYRLEAILAVGFRVRSHRGTQFRQWATARLGEYLVKGFTMDDERLKNQHFFLEFSTPIHHVGDTPKMDNGQLTMDNSVFKPGH